MSAREFVSEAWRRFQGEMFPAPNAEHTVTEHGFGEHSAEIAPAGPGPDAGDTAVNSSRRNRVWRGSAVGQKVDIARAAKRLVEARQRKHGTLENETVGVPGLREATGQALDRIGCVNQAPNGVPVVLPGRTSAREMKAVVQSASGPSGA